MCRIFLKHMYSNARIRRSDTAVKSPISHPYKSMATASDLYHLMLTGKTMLHFHIGCSLVITDEAI